MDFYNLNDILLFCKTFSRNIRDLDIIFDILTINLGGKMIGRFITLVNK